MTETHVEQVKLKSPFQEQVVAGNYFPGANFEQILQGVSSAIDEGVPLMVVTGIEGCGKTMLCHKLDHQEGDIYKTVLFPRTVDSFEDVVKHIAIRLGVSTEVEESGRYVDGLLENIAVSLGSIAEPLLLIFDEAENIYLATLERIRKMLERFLGDGVQLFILFSGRRTFLENFEQLSICEFREVEEQLFELEALSEAETTEYLLSASERIDEISGESIFSQEVLKNIFDVGKGNFRMTNILAEEAMQDQGDGNSFMVLLENVKDEVESEYAEQGSFSLTNFLADNKAYLPWAGGFIVVLGLLVSFLIGDGVQVEVNGPTVEKHTTTISKELIIEEKLPEESPVVQQPEVEVEVVAPPVVEIPATEPVIVSTPPVVVEEPVEEPIEEIQTAVIEASTEPVEETVSISPGEPEIKFEPEPAEVDIPVEVVVPIEPQEAIVVEPMEIEQESTPSIAGIPKIVVKKQKVELAAELPVSVTSTMVELRPIATLKRKPGSSIISKEKAQLPPVVEINKEEAIVERKSVASKSSSIEDQLYRTRVIAGTGWENGRKNHMYTVQLMVLTSKVAEQNLKKMLAEERYRQEAGNFYIFPRVSDPENTMIFYGEYRSLERARLAQNSLPQFLRDYKPYALSIKGAMAKVGR
ncbi:MAG: AAA family ATPase [Desulfobulbaceae bacterium]|nr:AAA family ATPase [Desulfobulbaceae bacterium]